MTPSTGRTEMIYRTLRALALTALYLVALAGMTVLVGGVGSFVVALLVLSAAYLFVAIGLMPRRQP